MPAVPWQVVDLITNLAIAVYDKVAPLIPVQQEADQEDLFDGWDTNERPRSVLD